MDIESTFHDEREDPKTALHVAVSEGNLRIVELLLQEAFQQCDNAKFSRFVNRQHRWGKTALMDACERDRLKLVKLLLSPPNKADWSMKDIHDTNALHYCAFRGFKTCVELLLRHASGADNPDPTSQSPIGQKRFATFLNQQNDAGTSPLHDAVSRGYGDISRLLLETYHADYKTYAHHNDSVLHRAVQYNHDEMLTPLLEYMSKDRDQEKFNRVLTHRNSSANRTVVDALEARGRKGWVDYVKKFGS